MTDQSTEVVENQGDDEESFTLAEFEQALPRQMQGKITTTMLDTLNEAVTNPHNAAAIRDNLISYTSVLKDGKFKLADYMKAVYYVTYKIMGNSDREAYQKAFPKKYAKMVADGIPSKDIASYVAAYNKGRLVNLILEQTLIPTYILNADNYQKAINVQVAIMNDEEVSAKVRVEAANSILNHLKRPEAAKVELSVTTENKDVKDLRQMLREIAINQQKQIEQGVSTKDIAHAKLIDITPENDDE